MCIMINGHDFQTSKTLLVVAPIATPPALPQAWQLIYINSVTSRPNPYNILQQSSSTKRAPLMVVPVPNPHHMDEGDFTLFAVDKKMAKSVRSAVDDSSAPYHPRVAFSGSANASTFGSVMGSSRGHAELKVQHIGGYQVSVAPSLSDLEKRAPWSQYFVTSDQVARILTDVRARYTGADFAFIVAEGMSASEYPSSFFQSSKIDQSGFGILYRDARENGCFFPLSHEPDVSNSAQVRNVTEMDVTVVALGAIIRPLSVVSHEQYAAFRNSSFGARTDPSLAFLDANRKDAHVVLRGDDRSNKHVKSKWRAIEELLAELPCHGAGELHSQTFVQHETCRIATIWNLQGTFANTDLYARKATPNDTAVVDRMLSDLGSWLARLAIMGDKRQYRKVDLFTGSKFPTAAPSFSEGDRLLKFDLALALLARQLSDPGICDRISDVPCRFSGQKRGCGPVAYMNLDLPNIDLDEISYQAKDSYARHVTPEGFAGPVDTASTSYIRISATLGPFESLEMRTVKDSPKNDTRRSG